MKQTILIILLALCGCREKPETPVVYESPLQIKIAEGDTAVNTDSGILIISKDSLPKKSLFDYKWEMVSGPHSIPMTDTTSMRLSGHLSDPYNDHWFQLCKKWHRKAQQSYKKGKSFPDFSDSSMYYLTEWEKQLGKSIDYWNKMEPH